jgi:hypothetical protein
MWMCGDKPILLKQRNGIKKTKANQTDGKPPGERLIATNAKSIGNINTLFSLFHQDKERDSRSRLDLEHPKSG